MEPTEVKVRWVITSVEVKDVIDRKLRRCVGGFGDNAKWEYESLGWYVHFDGSNELMFFGPAKGEAPPFAKGDKVKISFEKINE